MTEEELDTGVTEIHTLISADGGDLVLVDADVDADVVNLRLVLENAHCQECVLPRTLLEQVSADIFGRITSRPVTVNIDDPREAPGFVPAAH